MTDLTFCYLHMTDQDLKVLDTVGTLEYISGELSDDDLDIPTHMIPPNPDDSDILPSQVHPSYPYGNPTNIKHPAVRPRPPYDPTSRALFEDMGYAGGGVNGALRWRDLALDQMLPIDEVKEEMKRAAEARKLANGATSQSHQPQVQQNQLPPPQMPPDQTIDDDDEDDDEDSEHDENDVDENDDDEEGDEDDDVDDV
ncbi:hypothetical protein BJ138DRAFT_1065512 [Hygrophoropsis aurantiaca]|uniref:Uncharacterized protein n=1 Tax=Hygrophoropsis aurantiaca TaxID=72124 RepID=A0ACB8AAN9_9AGAM|nr:hypothetical protein BJ138DRAFT_1065512 [Hygrophoropsis aurantiaca]